MLADTSSLAACEWLLTLSYASYVRRCNDSVCACANVSHADNLDSGLLKDVPSSTTAHCIIVTTKTVCDNRKCTHALVNVTVCCS